MDTPPTIEDLARMINEGFRTTATKDDVTALRSEMNEKWLFRNSRENRTSFRGRPNISNGLTRRESEFWPVTTGIPGEPEKFDMVNSHLNNLDARVGRIEADVHMLRDEMVHRQEFHDALDRIKYIEKKLGIESGV